MSTLPAMPDKWAVKIENEAEAVELQELFPKHKHDIGRIVYFAASDVPTLCLSKNYETGLFGYAREKYYEENGYTIYTVNELKELLK